MITALFGEGWDMVAAMIDTPAVPASIPNLVGNWTGPAKGYIEGVGYSDFSLMNFTISITDQKDQCFSGYISFPLMNGTTKSEQYSGVIWSSGKSF
ncbi:MAG: hypothetical protein NT074_00525 [Methanomicrobiales archaeon]|nr:hypothetical protein [Methanomicrobiales archaeon]